MTIFVITKPKNMNIIETITKGEKAISIVRVVKEGTGRVFFVPVTERNTRLGHTLFARKYDAVALGNIYLKN